MGKRSKKQILEDFNRTLKENEIEQLSEFTTTESYIRVKDRDGYKYRINAGTFLNNNGILNGKFSSRNEYALENLDFYIKNNNSKTKVLSKKTPKDTEKLILECGECGEIFEQFTKVLIGNNPHLCCQKCAIKHRGETRIGDKTKFIEEIKSFGYVTLNEYKGVHNKVLVEDKEGFRGETCLTNLRKGSNIEKWRKNNPCLYYNIQLELNKNGSSLKVVEGSLVDNKATFICKCGEKFNYNYLKIVGREKTQCNKCSKSQSNLETIIEDWLILKNVKYVKQKRFKDCINKQQLPFDFYLEEFNTLIEVDGEHHYKIVRYNNLNETKAQSNLEKTRTRDKIKTKYCEDNKITLIRLPYWDIYNEKYKETLSILIR